MPKAEDADNDDAYPVSENASEISCDEIISFEGRIARFPQECKVCKQCKSLAQESFSHRQKAAYFLSNGMPLKAQKHQHYAEVCEENVSRLSPELFIFFFET